jgi:hypothetical protein
MKLDLSDSIWVCIFVMPYHKMKKFIEFFNMWLSWCHCYDRAFYDARKIKK